MKRFCEIASVTTFLLIFYFCPNLASAETIISDFYIDDTQTWTLQNSPYVVPNIYGGDIVISETGVLNIEAGVEVRVNNARKFDIYGRLNIVGSENNNVVFTNILDEVLNISDRWGGLVFYPGSFANINYLDIRNTGWVQFSPGGTAILNKGGSVSIKNSIFSKNSSAIENKAGTTTVEASIFDKNNGSILVESGYFSMTDSVVSDSGSYGFISTANGPCELFLYNNIFNKNVGGAFFDINNKFSIASTTFINGDINAWKIGGDLNSRATLNNIISPYNITGIGVNVGGELNIEPGVVIKGGYIMNNGGLININGTKNNPVIFTSITDDSVSGDTNNDSSNTDGESNRTLGVQVVSGDTNISNAILKYAKGIYPIGPFNQAFGTIINAGGNLKLKDIIIENGNHTAIHHYQGTTTGDGVNIKSGSYNYGIIYDKGDLKINNSSIPGDSISFYSLWNRNNLNYPDVKNNWWGKEEGPYHVEQNPSGTASEIFGNANFIPFLTLPLGQEKTIDPVIIVPGIMGSAYKNGELVIDPQFHVYDNLVETLEANGYEKNKDLFPFAYDWKKSNTYTAVKLKEKIEEIKNICDCDKVDVVAHSMGGLVARFYAQSEDYDNDIDQIIFLGTPHKGSPKDYLTWESGDLYGNDLSTSVLRIMYKKEAKKFGYNNLFDYIRNWPIYSVEELLPTYDYLKSATTSQILLYPVGYPENDFLENLNSGLVGLLEPDVNILNIVGNTGNNTISSIRVVDSNKLPLWEHGYPQNYDGFGDKGLEFGVGDGTVPEYSSKIGGPYDLEIQSGHINLPTDAEEEIYKELTGKNIGTTIKKSIPSRMLYAKIFSPADFVITAPDGKRVGKNFNTGEEINEIPGAFYSGFNTDDEYITIPDPVDGQYVINLQGTDSGFYEFQTSYISNNFATTTEVVGLTEPNQITNLSFEVDNDNPENIEVEKEVSVESIIIDINKAYDLGWITDKKVRDSLIKQVKLVIKFEEKRSGKYEKKVDKIILKILEKELELLKKKEKINQEAYNIIKDDLNWLVLNN